MRFHKALHLFDNIACYITPTAHTAKLLAKSGVAKEKIAVLPTFIDASAYQPRYDNDGYFLFLGRLSPEKGVDDILRAMALCPTARLKLTGKAEPAYEAHVKRLIDELGIGDRIEPTGFVQGEALQRLVQGARAMLLPAVWYENLPNAILEAFAYGKPVITSNLGSLPDAVQHERNGLLCRPHDPASLAECMRRLEESPALTQRLGMQARRDCEAKYAPEAYYEKLIALFRKAAGQ
ncbi:MAG: glycosyltransferase family 4 protein [Eubacteriales bacterium]|nr:glycosyltransferase family 4 protein [Eubacteriales bacterium]